jgi:undecaprenyl diphosphate synthase
LRDYLNDNSAELNDENIRLRVMGDISALPADLQTAISKALAKTKNNTGEIFNVGLNYGGRAEILRAVNSLLKSGEKSVTARELERELYTEGLPDPDLIVRTGGEVRLSNFMLYQAAYSEFYFCDCLWPDFDEKALDAAIKEYGRRTRKYGKIPNGG